VGILEEDDIGGPKPEPEMEDAGGERRWRRQFREEENPKGGLVFILLKLSTMVLYENCC
jgi:hypothetical protein